MFELDSGSGTLAVFKTGGWTLLTGIDLMLFSLIDVTGNAAEERSAERHSLMAVID